MTTAMTVRMMMMMTWLCPVRARGVHNNGLWWLRRTAERYRRHLSLPRQWSPSNAVQQRPLHHRPAVRTHHIRRIWIDCQGLQQLLCTCTNCSIINLLTITNYYCLSNAMHGENINLHLCVCVSVYVSVTLSVNSPTGQTPQRIFTVDSLKDTGFFYERMCLLGVSMMTTHIKTPAFVLFFIFSNILAESFV